MAVLTRCPRLTSAVAVTLIAVTLSACASTAPDMSPMRGMDSTPAPGMSMPATGMPGMDHPVVQGDGTTASMGGYTLTLPAATLTAGTPTRLRFQITSGDRPLTAFTPESTKPLHFYLIRADLTGFQHVHPRMAADGTWTAPLAPLRPGSYRAYASFVPATDATDSALVLGAPVTVAGRAADEPVPPASGTAIADGYTLTLTGPVTTGRESTLSVAFSRAGEPVTDLQPYLGTYAHLTAIHAGDLRFAHVHPSRPATGNGGPDLKFDATLPAAGIWRLFVQFRTSGTLHTATLTLTTDR